MARYRVTPGVQVNVDGVIYGPGETLEAAAGAVSEYLAAGWLEDAGRTVESKPAKKVSRKATT